MHPVDLHDDYLPPGTMNESGNMRVVVLSEWFSDKMGYAENELPRALAVHGADVHLVTSDLQPDFPNYEETYEPFLGPRQVAAGTYPGNGFTVHRLPHGMQGHGVYLRGLHAKLSELRPDVVQTFTIPSYSTYQAAASRLLLKYSLFLEEHFHKSVFRPGMRGKAFFGIFRHTFGPLISAAAEKCYPIAPDVADLVVEQFGIAREKLELCPLGVATDTFSPPDTPALGAERSRTRAALGFAESDIIFVYSGRFHSGKDPQLLAKAIGMVRSSHPAVKGLFVGSGTEEEVLAISAVDGCVMHPFVEARDLPRLYRAADVGVWPRQESTSQLDAAASGLPIIVSDQVSARERYEGNGAAYREGNVEDLARIITEFCDQDERRRMSRNGVAKIRDQYSWTSIAARRMKDYEQALRRS